MKIILTAHQFLPEYASGTEILTYSTARELKKLGHEVLVFTAYPARRELSDEERFDQYEYDGLRVVRFHHAFAPMGGQSNVMELEYANRLTSQKFDQLLNDFQPHIVHFFHLSRLSASLIDVCKAKRIPMVLTATDFWFVCPTSQLRLPDGSFCEGPDRFGSNCLKHVVAQTQAREVVSKITAIPSPLLAVIIAACRVGLLSQWSYARLIGALAVRPRFLRSRINLLDRVLVPTRVMGSILVRNGTLESRLEYCPFGIDLPAPTAKLRDRTISKPKHLSVGFIGTLYEHKGAHVLIDAVRRLNEIPITLKIYGRLEDFPEYVARLCQRAASDPRIKFLGTFPNNEIDQIFLELDVLVVPSLWYENSPLVVFSAQASRCPVIASDVGGLSEVISHEDNGLLFPKGDVAALAKLLDRLLTEEGLLARLSDRARQPKSSHEYAGEVSTIYENLLASPAASA